MTSFLQLNNLGIKRLEVGEYEQAANLFKSAFENISKCSLNNTTKNVCSANTRDDQRRRSTETNDDVNVCSDAIARGTDKCRTEGNKKRKQHASDKVESSSTQTPVNSNHAEQRRKRQRTNNITDQNRVERSGSPQRNNNNHESILCRPLWLEPCDEMNNRNVRNIYISSILYNFAYTVHQAAMSHVDKRKMLKKALATYGDAIRLALRCRCRMVQWMSCHNMQQILMESDETQEEFARKYELLESHKATVLRSLARNLSCDHMCLLVVSMLGVGGNEKPDTLAAAA